MRSTSCAEGCSILVSCLTLLASLLPHTIITLLSPLHSQLPHCPTDIQTHQESIRGSPVFNMEAAMNQWTVSARACEGRAGGAVRQALAGCRSALKQYCTKSPSNPGRGCNPGLNSETCPCHQSICAGKDVSPQAWCTQISLQTCDCSVELQASPPCCAAGERH